MSLQTGTASSYTDLLNQLDTFLTTNGMALVPSFVGVGNGTIAAQGGSASVAETITVTFTSSTAFGVVGSVSGSLGTGTVGTAFTSTKTNFTITAGGTAFVATDAFTFAVCPPWTSLRRNSGVEMIWQAPGNGGTDQIIVGAQVFSNVTGDYWNWRLLGAQAFDSGLTFQNQPGYVGGPGQTKCSPIFTLWNSTIPYWFVANGRRVIVVAQVSTVYAVCYLGLMSSYMAPGAFPYPLVVGGNLAFHGGAIASEPAATSPNFRWSYAGTEMRAFPVCDPNGASNDSDSALRLRQSNGNWRGFDALGSDPTLGKVWPYDGVTPANWDWRPNLDGSYGLLPIVLHDNTPNVYGELEGVKAITGFSQGALNTITDALRVEYLVVQNVFRNTKADFFAVRLS
jgi:hypothetical protein